MSWLIALICNVWVPLICLIWYPFMSFNIPCPFRDSAACIQCFKCKGDVTKHVKMKHWNTLPPTAPTAIQHQDIGASQGPDDGFGFSSGYSADYRSQTKLSESGSEGPEGSMYVLIILDADKTPVSVATGNVEYHPLYLSIGNLCNSAWHEHCNGIIPIGFLAIPKGMSAQSLLYMN